MLKLPEGSDVPVAGGTSTGKKTLVNALLAEVANTCDRVVLIEDTRELQCKAPNASPLLAHQVMPCDCCAVALVAAIKAVAASAAPTAWGINRLIAAFAMSHFNRRVTSIDESLQ